MWRRAASGLILTTALLVTGVSAFALDLKDLPEWVRDAIEPVEIDWSQLYTELAPVRTGLDLAGTSPTGAKAGDGLSAVSPAGLELERVSLGQASKRFKPPEPARADAGGMTLLARVRPLLEKGEVDRESFPQWAADQEITDDVLVQSLNSIPLSHPMDTIYLPISAALWQRIGDDIDRYLQFPYTARITMAIYMGVLRREEDAKKLLASIEAADKMAHAMDLYHVANELVAARGRSPLLAIWAWKRGAEMRGPADKAFVCQHIATTCRMLGDTTMVREQLVPWAESSLGEPGSETRWSPALRELVWAYDYLGDRGTAIERGRHWLRQARERGVASQALTEGRSLLAEVSTRAGRLEEASEILPPRLEGAPPSALHWVVRQGEDLTHLLNLAGNQTFRVARAHCTMPSIQTSLVDTGAGAAVRLDVRTAHETAGDKRGTLVIETNDAGSPRVEVPLTISILDPIALEPNSLFFGILRPGEAGTARVALRSALPFEVVEAEADRPQLIRLSVDRVNRGDYVLQAVLEAPVGRGVIAGAVAVSTTLPTQRQIRLPYYAHVLEPR